MKKKFIISLGLVLIYSFAFSQKDSIFYFNHKWEKLQDSTDAEYYRIISNINKRQRKHKVTDYFIDGKKQMEGYFSNIKKEQKTGKFIWYYQTGEKRIEANYKKDERRGTYQTFYSDGTLCQIREYSKKNFKILSAWDSTGNITTKDGLGVAFELDKDGKVIEEFEVKNGLRHGKCIGKNDQHKFTFQEYYNNGKFLYGVSTDSLNLKHQYKKIKILPQYPGDYKKLENDLKNNLVYPKKLLHLNAEDRVLCKFTINTNGEMVDIGFAEPSSYKEFNQQAYLALLKCSKWQPGYLRGVPVRVSYNVPINFKIAEVIDRNHNLIRKQ